MLRRRGDTAAQRGQDWVDQLARAQQTVEVAERTRDDIARRALDAGLGVRGVARALKIDKGTVSRRYGSRGAR